MSDKVVAVYNTNTESSLLRAVGPYRIQTSGTVVSDVSTKLFIHKGDFGPAGPIEKHSQLRNVIDVRPEVRT